MRKLIAIALAASTASLFGATAVRAASIPGGKPDTIQAADLSAKKKIKRVHQPRMHRQHRESFGYQRGSDQYRERGYYRGVQPGYGYGPDEGDRAWPPFHFRPYY
jgi:hypothetical protein